jgi:hypothetical protein
MISEYRKRYNHSFTQERYQNMLRSMNEEFGYVIPFRIAETPVFVPRSLFEKMMDACRQIISFIRQTDFKQLTQTAIPPHLYVPGDGDHSLFLAFDFGICRDEKGELVPRLIELQGFPSLFGWQHFLAGYYRKFFDVDQQLNHLFVANEQVYLETIRKAIIGHCSPDHTILMEVDPDNQNTRIDFLITERWWGVKTICISKVKQAGRELYYESDGRRIAIHRIYNRVIFDELEKRTDLTPGFRLDADLEVEWAGHPNWFFRISKFLLPYLKSEYVPAAYFLHTLKQVPADLENYVLKPLFSFSGTGVKFHVTRQDIEQIKNPEQYLLQRKVHYERVVQSPDEGVKAELRLLYLWPEANDQPYPVINMARLSKGEMIGVRYNKNKTWVGGSVGFYEPQDAG